MLAALRDIMHELFDPEDVGSLSRPVMHGVWRLIQKWARRHPSTVYHAGHLILIAVAGFWTAMLTIGWALVYWPHLPSGFHLASGLPASAGRGFGTALYVSLAALTTLASNDVVPLATWLRLAAALESLVGVAMITAWISWTLSIYPVLATRRSFEREVSLLQKSHPDVWSLIRHTPPEAAAELLRSLTEQVLRVSSDLSQSRVTYYFQNRREEISLARQLPYVLALGRGAESSDGAPAVRHRGGLLRRAVESALSDIGDEFLDMKDDPPDEILRALARDHLIGGREG